MKKLFVWGLIGIISASLSTPSFAYGLSPKMADDLDLSRGQVQDLYVLKEESILNSAGVTSSEQHLNIS